MKSACPTDECASLLDEVQGLGVELTDKPELDAFFSEREELAPAVVDTAAALMQRFGPKGKVLLAMPATTDEGTGEATKSPAFIVRRSHYEDDFVGQLFAFVDARAEACPDGEWIDILTDLQRA